MATTQTLAAGPSVQETFAGKYKPVGIKGKELRKPLNRCFWQAIGAYAHGKSRLIQTNPKALILNLDESPTTHPNPEAEIWPPVDAMGQTVDTDGSPLTLTWGRVLEVLDHVLAAKRSGLPDTPECVVFDSLPSAVRLCLYHTAWKMTNKAVSMQTQGRGSEVAVSDISAYDLKSFHGQVLYGTTYDVLADTFHNLLHNNIGVGLVVHVDTRPIEIAKTKDGEAVMEERTVLSISDPFRERFHRNLDFSFQVQRRKQMVTETVKGKKKKVKAPGGVEMEVEVGAQQIQKRVDQTMIVTESEALVRYLKVREGLPLEFPVDSWRDLEAKYNDHS
jgi:hypothetical protein